MVIAAIFAGGIGSRMGNSDTPKQYLELGTKPVIIHTIEKFFINDKIDEILVLCPKAWVAHTRDLVAKHLPDGLGGFHQLHLSFPAFVCFCPWFLKDIYAIMWTTFP